MSGQEGGELRGLLGPGVLAELLRRLFVARRSGVLHLAFGVDRSDIEFRAGHLIHAVTTLPGAHLGDLLVQVGFLCAADRDMSLEIAALSDEKIGESLLRRGLLDPEPLAQGLALQLREVLARTLCWSGGVYTFTDLPPSDPAGGEEFVAPHLDPREVLLDATWTLVGQAAIDALLGDLDWKLGPATSERLRSFDFRLTPGDAFLLSRANGELTARQILEQSPLPLEEAKASLAGLLAIGAIEYVNAPPATSVTTKIARLEVARLAARINSPNPFEVMGVPPEATTEELRSAYLKLLRSCDPASTTDPSFRPILARMCEQLAEAFKEIERRRERRHHEVPVKPPGRKGSTGPVRRSRRTGPLAAPPRRSTLQPPPAKAPVPAPPADPARAVEEATRAFEEGRFYEALALLHGAIPLLQGRARRAARVKKARVLLAVENGARLAEEELKLALNEDPGNAEAQVILGGLYRERGAVALALAAFSKALELEPRNLAAREAIQQIRPSKAETHAPSALKRIFGGA